MPVSRVIFSLSVALFSLSLVAPSAAFAQKKNKATPVDLNQIFETQLTIQLKQKSKKGKGSATKEVAVNVACAPAGKNGEVIAGKRGAKVKKGKLKGFYSWKTYDQLLKKAKLQLRKKGSAKNKSNVARLKAILEVANEGCANSIPGSNSPEDPDVTPLVLNAYTGPFGTREAALLYRRFAFGATAAELTRAVSIGLEATVDELLDWDQAGHDSLMADYQDWKCDQNLKIYAGDNHRDCNLQNPNDFSLRGMQYGWMDIFARSTNPAHMKFLTVLHSDFAAGQIGALNNGNQDKRWFAAHHFEELLLGSAQDWDYRRFLRDQSVGDPNGLAVMDPLAACFNLDGCTSFGTVGQNGLTRSNANENYAREFWELSSLGVAFPNGTPTYGVLDIICGADRFAGSGYVNRQFEVGLSENGAPIIANVSYPVRVGANTIPGSCTVFAGTPYEAVVSSNQDLFIATLNHPMTAYNVARKLLKNYMAENPAHATIERLARLIREDNYNLRRVMKIMMMAEQNFLPHGQRSVVLKSAFDLIFSWVRPLQIPFHSAPVFEAVAACGQELGEPGNRSAGKIFGWDVRALNGETNSIPCRNEITDLLEYLDDVESFYRSEERNGPNYSKLYEVLFSDKPFELRADVHLVDKVTALLGYELNTAQRQFLIQDYLNKRPELCDNQNEVNQYQCTLGTYFSVNESFSESPFGNYNNFVWKIGDLVMALVDMPEFRER
ncbi:MAG: DUF1800 family protein [Bdellovibrionales bacterium]|nr:DUF1800 family protein [Bdellovibrionales bacterium]